MFSLKPLSGCDFAWAAAIRNGAYLAACLLFTPAVMGLTLIYDCTRMDGPCFAALFFMVQWLKPVVYGLFILSFIGIVIGRAHHAGLPLVVALGIVLLLFADMRFGITLGFATGANLALVGFWGGAEPRFFLAAFAGIATLCVLRPASAAPEPWPIRLGTLAHYGVAVVAALLVAAAWGGLESARTYLSFVGAIVDIVPLWSGIGRLLGIVACLGPPLLLPIAVQEWRKAGAPGEGGRWHRAASVSAVLVCVAAILYAVTAVLLWLAPDWTLALARMVAIPVNAFNLVALLAAFALPALIAKMLVAGAGRVGTPA
jgi:hypothetical protein